MLRARYGALFIVSLLIPAAARSQTLRGVAVDASDQPVSGVVVMLLDSAWTRRKLLTGTSPADVQQAASRHVPRLAACLRSA
jgi:hypothetical protein